MNLSNKNINPNLSPSQLMAITDQVLEKLGQSTAEQICQNFLQLSTQIDLYLDQFDKSYQNFIKDNHMKRTLDNYQLQIKHGPQDKPVPVPKLQKNKYQNNRKSTQEFIQIFQYGRKILSKVREAITNQSISTEVTIVTSKGTYRIPEPVLQGTGAVKTVLSTFGANQNSFFSLAYEIDLQNQKLINILQDYLIKETGKTGDDIYEAIWHAKELYLIYLSMKNDKKTYKPVFNSKDAEIYNLMYRNNYSADWLTREKYQSLRKIMGGGGGYRTSSIKMGDVGLIQDKLITERQNQVNFASFGLVRNNLQKLSTMIKSTKNNPQQLAQELIHQFTEKRSLVNDNITYQANEEAKLNIMKLFGI